MNQLDILLQDAIDDAFQRFSGVGAYILRNGSQMVRQHFTMLKSILRRKDLNVVHDFATLAIETGDYLDEAIMMISVDSHYYPLLQFNEVDNLSFFFPIKPWLIFSEQEMNICVARKLENAQEMVTEKIQLLSINFQNHHKMCFCLYCSKTGKFSSDLIMFILR